MSSDQLAEQLSAVDLFRGMSQRAIKRLAGSTKEIEHVDGRTILDEGGMALGFHLVLDGEAAVVKDGKEQSLLRKGAYFGEMSLIDGQPRSVTVIAKRGLRTAYINNTVFQALLRDNWDVAFSVMKVLSARVRRAEQEVRQLHM
jgi:CRP-like cAMP-binding protein